IKCYGKIRYNHIKSPCQLSFVEDNILLANFEIPQRAITPGQAIVFYDEFDQVLGGGTIRANN
ncbi:MAG: aminomethyltransferase beta-barrel domain-containing protein, partial [Lachnospirales bacterium]